MLQNKITNRVFAEMWNQVLKSQATTVATLEKRNPKYISKHWRNGAVNTEKLPTEGGYYVGIEGLEAKVPVQKVQRWLQPSEIFR